MIAITEAAIAKLNAKPSKKFPNNTANIINAYVLSNQK